MRKELDVPNADHDQDGGDGDALVVRHLVQAVLRIEVPSTNSEVQNDHHNSGDGKPENALPAHDFDRLHGVLLHDTLLEHKLRSGEDLRSGNEQYTNDGQ